MQRTLLCLGLMALVYTALIGNYYTVSPQNLAEWGQRIAAKCQSSVIDSKTSYQTRSMLDVGQTAFGFGAYLGLFFKAKYLANIQV